jgi:hypothetical protein
MRADLQNALAFHFDSPGPFHILEHHERLYVIDGAELVTRIAMDDLSDEREIVYRRMGEIIKIKAQAEALAHGVTNLLGESVYVCALPQDTLGWLMDQLDERGDALSAAVVVADQMLLTLPFAYGSAYAELEDTYKLGGSNFDRETRLSEIIQATNVVTPMPKSPINRRPATHSR